MESDTQVTKKHTGNVVDDGVPDVINEDQWGTIQDFVTILW